MPERPSRFPSTVLNVTLATLHLAVSILILFALSYLLGHSIFDGGLQGSDSPLHVGYAVWLDEYFPRLPHWYPLQGGGASILHGYPLLAHLIVVVLHRLTGLSILQTFRLVSFAAFPLTALGVYAFSWSVLKRQTIGLIAAVFFLLAPVTWTWMYNWGFVAQQVAIVFLPPALIAFDRTLHHQLAKMRSGRGRLWFTALVILVVAGSLSHMLVGAAAAMGFVLLTVFSAVTERPGDRQRTLRGGVKIILLLGATAGLLVAAYLVPFYAYSQVANREGLNTPPPSQLHRLPLEEFFGLTAIDPLEILTRMQFPALVTGFALLGVLLALLFTRRRIPEGSRALAIALALIVATVITLSPWLVALVLRLSPFLVQFINFRSSLLMAMVFMPVMAAYGVWALAWSLLHPEAVLGLNPSIPGAGHTWPSSIRPAAASLVSLLIAGACLIPAGVYASAGEGMLAYGPLPKGVKLRDVWDNGETGKEDGLLRQLAPERWPAPTLSDADPNISRVMELGSLLPLERPLRIDVSPYLGRLAMDLTTYADVSQINAYTYTTSLVHAMWGYQQNVFYSHETPVHESGNPRTLNGAAQWFGTQYVFLNSAQDPVETYKAAGWELFFEDGNLQVWHDPRAPAMATATTRPAILVVGRQDADTYMTVFRLANDGMLPYDEALLVEGQPRVDRYTLEQLKPFDAVFLYGYDYKNGDKAWDTLAAYVEQGGRLFVDTGWEYWIPEWEFESAPDVLPVNRLTWTDYGMATSYELGAPDVAGDVDVGKFKPLIWEGAPWTLSGAEASDIRDWGRAVLSAGGRPLIVAGEYGEGKVVWSGMNLIGHARYGDPSQEEIRLLGNLLRWLTGAELGAELPTPLIARDNPDRVGLSFAAQPGDVTWLFWRESYYPDWHAYLTDGAGTREIPIYRGGPGFMLMPIETPSQSVSVRLAWEPSFLERAAIAPSLLGLALLAGLFLDGLLFSGNLFTWVKIAITMRVPSPFLGEGFNHEWAERKRAELEYGQPSTEPPKTDQPAQAIAWWRGDRTPEHPNPGSAEPDGNEDVTGVSIGAPGGEAERALLKAWLEEAGHSDDAWVQKLLSGRRPDGRASAHPDRLQATGSAEHRGED